MNKIRQRIRSVTQHTHSLACRTLDKHIRLGVTGLSGAGKTAFITGLVHQLTQPQTALKLPLLSVSRQGRLLGASKEIQPDFDIPSFNYEGAIKTLSAQPPRWPDSTRNISELRLAIKYRPKAGLLGKVSKVSTLYLDIVDYPGEWLLDLPMLRLDFPQWCQQQSLRIDIFSKSPYYADFIEGLKAIPLSDKADELLVKKLTEKYQLLLQDLVYQQGFYMAQPGRLLLPGELADTPLLTFFPILTTDLRLLADLENSSSNSYYHLVKRRYQKYISQVVKPFYRQYFARFDRQLVLVDCLTALTKGRAQFGDMTNALNNILESFRFGSASLLNRLFTPKIDKLLFVASKADHVTQDQQGNLLTLLTKVLGDSQHFAQIKGTDVEVMSISAIRATQAGKVVENAIDYPVIQGHSLSNNQWLTLFPGEVPTNLPNEAFWQTQSFEFTAFRPQDNTTQEMQHIRLDSLLEFLLGDKLQ